MKDETRLSRDELEQRINDLEARMDAMSKRLKRALDEESNGATGTSTGERDDGFYDPTLNRRQREILDGIFDAYSMGDVLSRGEMRRMIRSFSDVSRKKTETEYIKTLAKSRHFRRAGNGKWEFVGGVVQ